MGGVDFLPYNKIASDEFFKKKNEEKLREEQKAKAKASGKGK